MATQNEIQKPQSVLTAGYFIWASSIFSLYMALSTLRIAMPVEFRIAALVLGFGLISFLVVKLSAGKNWARIVFLTQFLVGVLPAQAAMVKGLPMPPTVEAISLVGALSLISFSLQAYALYLVFTKPGNIWFHKITHGRSPQNRF